MTEYDMSTETWLPIPGFEKYVVSSWGNVKNSKSGKAIKNSGGTDGYVTVAMTSNSSLRKSMRVHRLVAQAFIPNPNNLATVNHIDGCKSNNKINNLEWASQKEQNEHAYKTGLMSASNTRAVIKLDKEGNILQEYVSISDAERTNNLAHGSIYSAIKKNKCSGGFNWKYASIERKDNMPEGLIRIPNFSGYGITKGGVVWSYLSNDLLRPRPRGRYKNLCLKKDDGSTVNMLLHRLVALTYIENPNPERNMVNHIDGNPGNNSLENLEWVTHVENVRHALLTGLRSTKAVVRFSMEFIFMESFPSIKEAAIFAKTSSGNISFACKGTLEDKKIIENSIWRYASDCLLKDDNTYEFWGERTLRKNCQFKGVCSFTKQFSFIAFYPSIKEAARVTGASQGGLTEACKSDLKVKPRFGKGNIFRYVKDCSQNADGTYEFSGDKILSDNSKIRPVVQFDKKFVFIKAFDSILEAKLFYGGSSGGISESCKADLETELKTSKNSIWRYASDCILKENGAYEFPGKKILRKKVTRAIKICQFDAGKKFIKIYDSLTDAKKQTGARTGHITEVCQGLYGKKSSKGFIWRYASDCIHNPENNTWSMAQ